MYVTGGYQELASRDGVMDDVSNLKKGRKMEGFQSPSKGVGKQEINSSEESEMGTHSSINELIDFLCCEELNDADSQDRESTSERRGKSKLQLDSPEEQPCLNLSVKTNDEISPSGNLTEKLTTEFEDIIKDFILPKSVGKAIDQCNEEQRKTIDGDDVIEAAKALGFDEFLEPLKKYMQEHAHRTSEEDDACAHAAAAAAGFDEFFNLKSEEYDACADVPGYEVWYKSVQDLLAMVHSKCCTSCPCRLVKFTRANYK